jgi:hypothetical protein
VLMKIKKEPVAILASLALITGGLTTFGVIPSGIGGGIIMLLMAIGGPGVRAAVTSNYNVDREVNKRSEERVAEAAVEALSEANDLQVGPTGLVTNDGKRIATDVVVKVTNTPLNKASTMVSQILTRRKAR